jgi:uncharacterized protein YbjT (DUF2867 family)
MALVGRLVPARLRTMEEMAKDSGIPGDVLRQAYTLIEADKAGIAAEKARRWS